MNAHRRIIRTYKVQSQPPQSLNDHWQIFTKIAKHIDTQKPWCCEILFFSDAWISKQQDNVLWSKFNSYLYSQAWIESAYLRNKTILNLLWEILASSLIKNDLKLKPYLMQTIKQLTAIAYGFAPGYKAAGKNEAVAPISAIEDAYINVYELKEYLPIIMHPNSLNDRLQHSTHYYSLSADTLHEGSFTTAHPPRIINKLREVKQLMEIANRSTLNNPLLQSYLDDEVNYQYFHITEDRETNIKSSKDMPLFDPTLIETFYPYKNRIFPAASPFMRGCVGVVNSIKRIKNRQDNKEENENVNDFTSLALEDTGI